MAKEIYRGFEIWHDPKPGCLPGGRFIDFTFAQVDFDLGMKAGACETVELCKQEIDEFWAENAPRAVA